MEVTRAVILDLMPLYLANELSKDSRQLVEEFLNSDQELAALARQSQPLELSNDIPFPLSTEDKMKAYREAQQLIFRRTVVWAVVISLVLLAAMGLVLLAALSVGVLPF